MITKSKYLTIFSAVTLMTMPAMAKESGGKVSIKFAGERDWEVACTFAKDNGKSRIVRRNGTGFNSIKSIALSNVLSGKCELDVPEGTTLKATFTGSSPIECPFEDTEQCLAIFTESDKANFSF